MTSETTILTTLANKLVAIEPVGVTVEEVVKWKKGLQKVNHTIVIPAAWKYRVLGDRDVGGGVKPKAEGDSDK